MWSPNTPRRFVTAAILGGLFMAAGAIVAWSTQVVP